MDLRQSAHGDHHLAGVADQFLCGADIAGFWLGVHGLASHFSARAYYAMEAGFDLGRGRSGRHRSKRTAHWLTGESMVDPVS